MVASRSDIPFTRTQVGRGMDGAASVRHVDEAWTGHSVLQVPVPPLEPWVKDRTRHYDAGFVSSDPAFTHAHVTILAPFVTTLDEVTTATIAEIVDSVSPFDFALARVATFPNGLVHLAPEPDSHFTHLTALFTTAFTDHRPYGGKFSPAPHLTLDQVHGAVTEESTRALLGDLIPVTCRAEWLDLAWYESGNCHLRRRWRLGGTHPEESTHG